jgi:hypothetical protein
VIVVRAREPRPFRTIFLASALAGVLTGLTQGLLQAQYIANNPWYAADFAALGLSGGGLALQFVAIGALMGTLFGVGVGAIAWRILRRLY